MLRSDSHTDSRDGSKSSQTGQSGQTAETGDEVSKEVKDKSRIDDLWASFKRDAKFKIPTMTTAATTVSPSSQGKVHF